MCVCVCVQMSVSNVLTVSCPWGTVPHVRVSLSPPPPLILKSIVDQNSHSYFHIIQVLHKQVLTERESRAKSK